MNKRIFFFSALIFSIIASAFFSNANISYARNSKKHLKASSYQYNEINKTLTVHQNFPILETAENNGTIKNVSSIDIDLETPRWNVTNIEFNITDMAFKNETKIIEDSPFDSYRVYRLTTALAVQINVTEDTRIYRVKIFGRLINQGSSNNVYVQIQGYNSGENKPNGLPLRSTPLNMTNTINEWRIHKFSPPVDLSKGIYCLVINGTNIGYLESDEYKWYANEDPNTIKDPSLYSWEFVNTWFSTDYWDEGVLNRTFLYKLDQRIIEDFSPEEINMKAEINGKEYPIEDGDPVVTGSLNVSFNNFFPDAIELNIPIKNNISDALIFNLTYYVKLKYSLSCRGSVLIKADLDNQWTLKPTLNRFGYNYSIKYEYPDNLRYVSVWKNDINITNHLDVLKIGNSISILNDTINQSTGWKITANSTRIDPIIDHGGQTSYSVPQEIQFWVRSLPNEGNYTCILTDSIGNVIYSKLIEKDNTDDFSYNYTFLLNARSGEWTALVFWNNETDAGIQTQLFQITSGGGITILPPSGDDDDSKSTTEVDYSLVVIGVILTGLVIAGGFSSFTAYKKVMKIRELKKEKLYKKFLDAFNLNNVIVINKKSGLNVYEQFFAGKKLDATLISGFLDAIRAFGIELTSAYEKSQTISLEYKASKILMSEFKDFRLICILKDRPSEEFLKSVTALSYDIDREYGELLQKFDGNLTPFAGIKGLIEHHLNTSFISPLKIIDIEKIELSPAERSLVQKAKSIMKQNKLDYFFTTFLMPEQAYDPKRTQLIFQLIEKKVFQPTDISFS
ncbi:MAG: hypothetical protein EU535_07220 [Promethearchaeota archaeon]|nr:MAG: hypothetical protein EU535_07220 [Candidatus Lokiarchaeota archaeon]